MKRTIKHDTKKTIETFQDNGRIYYQAALNKAYNALKAGKSIDILNDGLNNAWTLIFVVVDGKEYQLTKKMIRTSDLKFYFQDGV